MWRRRHIPANENVITEGEQCSDLYLVLEGTLRVIGNVSLDDERRVRPGMSELTAGDVFGELALFDKEPRSATVVAVTDCEVAAIDGEKLTEFLESHPDIGYKVLRELITGLVTRLRKTNVRLISLFAWGLKAHQIDEHL